MSITVQTCPRCSALVMGDAAECHLCHYVFDRDKSRAHDPVGSLPSDSLVAEDLELCPKCGEANRTGVVRCSNCGAFTRPDVEAEFHRRKSAAEGWSPARFDLPEYTESKESRHIRDVEDELIRDANRRAAAGGAADQTVNASDEDFEFELAGDIRLSEAAASAVAPATRRDAPKPEAKPAPAAAHPADVSAKAAPEKSAEKKRAAPDEAAQPHSEATGGDALLKIAQQEEADIEKSRRTYRDRIRGGFIVYCPRGCRIRVSDRHRGRTGKCPRCGSLFVVPAKPIPKAMPKEGEAAAGEAAATQPGVYGKWKGWIEDVHAHSVVPQKLKIKPDSLLKDFQAVDVSFSEDGMLLVTLIKSAGMFGANEKKKPALRTATQEHLKTVGKVDGLPAASQRLYPTETLKQVAMAQPTPPDVDSLFSGVPVFGAGRVAVKLPKLGDETANQYLSFSLSQFREFAQRLEAAGGPAGLGSNTEAPLTETYTTLKCHYTDQPVQELMALAYYRSEPKVYPLQVSGWRCGQCSLVVSEDARKKEKIGGLDGKGIAKAKCPKCGGKFGSNPLYQIAQPSTAPAAETSQG
jgi:hypothetical protein